MVLSVPTGLGKEDRGRLSSGPLGLREPKPDHQVQVTPPWPSVQAGVILPGRWVGGLCSPALHPLHHFLLATESRAHPPRHDRALRSMPPAPAHSSVQKTVLCDRHRLGQEDSVEPMALGEEDQQVDRVGREQRREERGEGGKREGTGRPHRGGDTCGLNCVPPTKIHMPKS